MKPQVAQTPATHHEGVTGRLKWHRNFVLAPVMAVVRLFLQPPAQNCFLFDPRGTGESTWPGRSSWGSGSMPIQPFTPARAGAAGSLPRAHGLQRSLRALGWRLVSPSMPPLMASELGPPFNLGQAQAIGLVPLIWQAINQMSRGHPPAAG
jgi:hypothetical protein